MRSPRTKNLQVLACLAGSAFAVSISSQAAHAQTPPRIVKGPYVQELEANAVTVRVEVDPPVPVRVAWSLPGGQKNVVESAAAPFHSVRITGLLPKKRYEYAVELTQLAPKGGAPARESGQAVRAVAKGEEPEGEPVSVAAADGATTSERGAFTTAPPDSEERFRFLVYGDNRSDPTAHRAVVRAILSASPGDFLLNTGDLVEDGANPQHWQTFFDIERPLLKNHCVYAAIGNHELLDQSGANFLRYFGPSGVAAPARDAGQGFARVYRTFRWGSARFFLLNAYDGWVGSDARNWLDAELARADGEPGVQWRFVVLHHGPHSSGPHGGNQRMTAAGIPELLAQHKVDLVLSGHDHIYERGDSGTVRYIVTGGGGAPLYRVAHREPGARMAEATYHFLEADVTPDVVKFLARRHDGSVLERCGLTKKGWDCDKSKSAEGTQAPPGPPPSRCGCRVAGDPAASLRTPGGQAPSSDARGLFVGFAAASMLFGIRRRLRRGLRRGPDRDRRPAR
jgi:hypothetical protein